MSKRNVKNLAIQLPNMRTICFSISISLLFLTTDSFAMPPGPAASSDGNLIAAGIVVEPVNLPTTVDTLGEAVDIFDFEISDGGGDPYPLAFTTITVNVSGTSSDTERSQVTFLLNGPDANNVAGAYNAVSDELTFSGLSIVILNNTSEVYTISAYYNDSTSLIEDHTIILSIDGDTDLTYDNSAPPYTNMQSTTPVTNGTGTAIVVEATALSFTTQPAISASGYALGTQPAVAAVDAFGNTDNDFTETITLTESSAGSLTNATKAAASGVATFTNLTYSATVDQQSFTLTANDQDGVGTDLPTVNSNALTCDVVATKLEFVTQPSPTTIKEGQSVSFTTVPVVRAVDLNDVPDTGYSTDIVLSEVNGAGSVFISATGDNDGSPSTATITPSSGASTFTGLQVTYTAVGGIDETFKLRATSGGLTSADSTQLTADQTPPAASSTPDLTAASDTGSSSTDNITSDTTPTFTGTSEANCTISFITTPVAGLISSTTADGAGNWSATGDVFPIGTTMVSATASDPAGNVSNASASLSITVDTSAPSAPSVVDLSSASDSGISNSDNVTIDTTPTFTGTAEANSIISIISSVDATLGTVVADGAGSWSFTSGVISEGVHNITSTATDISGNTSSPSSALSMTVDTVSPTGYNVTLNQDAITQGNETSLSFLLSSAEVGTNYSYQLASSGGGATVSGSAAVTSPSVAITGIDVSSLNDGVITLSVTLTDNAGNVGSAVTDTANKDTTVSSDNLDTDGDGTPDSSDSDDDNDGVTDTQEGIDGTDPLDSGSYLPVLPKNFCAEWNGFLNGLWNVLEFVNLSNNSRRVVSTIKDINGVAQSSVEVTVQPGAQTDLLVHDMPGWVSDSYGQVCVSVPGAQPGDVDGRMVYYKPNSATTVSSGDVQFAFASPYFDGLTGPQYVFFNTYQPSLDPADSANLVTNWIQLTNLGQVARSGTLTYYGQDGDVLAQESITIEAGARRDFSGHSFGTNLVGMIKWSPNNDSAKFQMRNVRYYYDNSIAANSFDSALQLKGTKGSGKGIIAPVDTRIGTSVLEVGNTRDDEVTISVKIYDKEGVIAYNQNLILPAYGSQHIVINSILDNSLGLAVVDGPGRESAIATVMQYGRTPTNGVQFIYGSQARQPLGSVIKGTYNTFLEQDCNLLISNSSSSSQTVSVSAVRSDGTTSLESTGLTVAAHGVVEFDLCQIDQTNHYGVVTVQPELNNTIAAEVVRIGDGNSYRFSTPVRQ